MRLYGQFQKIEPLDDGTVKVHGIASSEAVDDQGEVVRAEAMRAAIPDYMQFPALREMHQLQAAGTTLEAVCDDDGCTRIVAHVVDPVAVSKVKNKVYRGFSIGGRVTSREAGSSHIINGVQLNEISLVDRPANPEAVFDVWKAASAGERNMDGGLGTLGDVLAAQIAAQRPVQKWDCGLAEHNHGRKDDAAKCMVKRAADAVPELDAVVKLELNTDAVTAAIKAATDAIKAADSVVKDDMEETAKAEDKKPYGDVNYADPGYQSDKKKRYPLDTEAHVRAAWSYINMPKNGKKYSAEQLSSIKGKIQAAGKKLGIEFSDDGKKASMQLGSPFRVIPIEMRKALWDVGRVAESIMCLDHLKESLELERAMEGDDSDAPAEVEAIIAQLCAFMRNLVAEETQEMMEGTEVDEDDMPSMGGMMAMALVLPENAKGGLVKKMTERLEKATRSARDQSMLNLAHMAAKAGSEVRGIAKSAKDHFEAAAASLEKAGAMPLPADYDRENPDDTDEAESAAGGDQEATTDTGDNPEHPAPSVTPPAAEFVSGRNYTVDTSKTVMALITTALGKANGHQHFADVAHDCVGKLTDGAACAVGKAGARFSAETMGHLRDAHDHLTKAGAVCKANMMDEPKTQTQAEHQGTQSSNAGADLGMAGDKAAATDDLRKVTDERDQLMKVLSSQTEMLQKMMVRIENIEKQPLPALAAGRGAASLPRGVVEVSKTDDGRITDHDATEKESITPQRAAEAWKNMTQEEQTLALIKGISFRVPYVQR